MKLKVNGVQATHTQMAGKVQFSPTPQFESFLKNRVLEYLEISESENVIFENPNVFNGLSIVVGNVDNQSNLDDLFFALNKAVKNAEFDAGDQVFTISNNLNDNRVDIYVNPTWGLLDVEIVE